MMVNNLSTTDILKAKERITKKTTRKSSKNRRKKNMHGAKTQPSTSMDCLPPEMISEVLARVAASSPVDLIRCKLSCKSLQKISDEKEVLQQVSLGTIWRRVWLSEKASTFFTRCLESNNPEALLHLGFAQYFTHMVQEEGLKNMAKAAELKYKEAAYVLGLIYLCNGEEEDMKKGVELLMNTGKVIGGKGLVKCRKNLRDMMYSSWMNNKLIVENKPKISCAMRHQHEKNMSNWDKDDYYHEDGEDNVVCETCKCAREVDFFYKLMHVV